jgi:hypothetical protein
MAPPQKKNFDFYEKVSGGFDYSSIIYGDYIPHPKTALVISSGK